MFTFIDSCSGNIIAIPSKENTAVPMNKGNEEVHIAIG
jgi:hypothetical protein